MTFYQITTEYYCAGVVTDDRGYVIDYAPILKWTRDKHINEVIDWVNRKGYKVVTL